MDDEQQLQKLIAQVGAVSRESWGGPFDPTPAPVVGGKAVGERLSLLASNVEVTSNQLLRLLRDSNGDGAPIVAVARGYYAARIADLRGTGRSPSLARPSGATTEEPAPAPIP